MWDKPHITTVYSLFSLAFKHYGSRTPFIRILEYHNHIEYHLMMLIDIIVILFYFVIFYLWFDMIFLTLYNGHNNTLINVISPPTFVWVFTDLCVVLSHQFPNSIMVSEQVEL